ncbi:uncharacterized protein [Eurosta solidaginis]|uniref:uncharacterized protein n=1 Tax=Eurosta solidaginis TaxID=178769 RepID=UPI003530AC7A
MPRVNNNVKDANGSTSPTNVNVAGAKGRKRAIKKEVVESAGEQNVFHRKSERRRVARDIFLVFEEQPCRRGRGGGGNSKRRTTQKSKFGHLMVDDHCRTTKAGLLRDIKNEPKCYLNDECTINPPVVITTAPAAPPSAPIVVATKEDKKKNTPKAKKSKNNSNVKSSIETKPLVLTPTKLPDAIITKESSSVSKHNDDEPVCARVNPIFLWVKQEDTHIVEVRCEDYDKRNRIRITKTTNGWRAIPRTDPTSSKIVKIIQTPLLKVKKELYENNLMQKCNANILGRQIVIQQQQLPEVNEKQSFVTENAIMVDNCLNFNNKKGIIDNLMVNKESDQIENSTSGAKEGMQKYKKVKTKKEGKKRGRKAKKLNIPKVEVQQEPLQEALNQNDFVETEQMQQLHASISNQKQEAECQALPIDQLLQSNLETIQNFSKMSISDHHHNKHSIVEHLKTASDNININNHFPEAIELQSDEAEEQQTVEAAKAIATTSAVPISNKAIEEAEEVTYIPDKVNGNKTKAQTESEESQTYQHHSPHLQLCPITGLFLPTTNIPCRTDVNNRELASNSTSCDETAACVDDNVVNTFNTDFLSKDILVDLANCNDNDDGAAVEEHNLPDSARLQTLNAHFGNTMDADTKNLKDLLDEADLMQPCHDNALTNSDADIIDSIVKRSCENNLIQENEEALKEAEAMHQQQIPTQTSALNANNTQIDGITQRQQHHKDLMSNIVPLPQHNTLIDDAVRDSPKCLSFNEAGEIEGLNGELFQTNHFMDTYEKDSSSVEEVCLSEDGVESVVKTPGNTKEVTALASPAHLALKESGSDDDVIMEETPKDLSYKKREEVCPPSESRSQCAVTSSSDIIKSPQQGELPAIETTSEAIKNLILEQFMKLNAYNVPTSATNTVAVAKQHQQQIEPINLGKTHQRNLTTTPPTTNNDCNSNYATSTNYIETVVIDDNSDDEPMKKRIRSNNNIKVNKVVEEPGVVGSQTHAPQPPAAALLIDKDPDPLTQLQLLIRNTQWKVPDPILVPKDRLRAVLASPAREIPLLITTRPELRLPEAFAYPEIIQNPNILVISMAQLEAILKNEMEMEQSKQEQEQQQQQQCVATEPIIHQHELPIENLQKSVNGITHSTSNNNNNGHNKQSIEHTKSIKVKEPPLQQNPINTSIPTPTALPPPKCSHVDTNLASDINAATLAVLNQMLWLPYFGQLSQEFLKTLNKPMGVQNKYNATGLLPPPLYNHHMGLQHIDEMYKNYLKQMTALKHLSADATNVNNVLPNFSLPLGAFQPTMETNVFQKMLQHQLANFLNINPLVGTSEATAGASTPVQSGGHAVVGKSPSVHDMTRANVEHMHMAASVEENKKKCTTSTTTTTKIITAEISGSLVGDVATDKSSSIRHNSNNNSKDVALSCDNASATESVNFNKYAYALQQQPQKQEIDNKPRLTCKSLSNLLEPAENVSSSPIVPLVNLTKDHHHVMRNNTMVHELANNSANTNSLINPASIHNKESVNLIPQSTSVDVKTHFKSGKLSNKVSNIGLNVPHEVLAAKQRKRIMNYAAETALATSPAMGAVAASAATLGNQTPSRNVVVGENINMEPNQALWHPLFGSNAKTGYSSPWQWTTVTATGE